MKYRMSPEMFEEQAKLTRLKPRMLTAARRSLVDGLTFADAAREAGCRREVVRKAAFRLIATVGVCPTCHKEI